MSVKPPGESKPRSDRLKLIAQSDRLADDAIEARSVRLDREIKEGIDVCLKLIKSNEQVRAQNARAAKATNVVNLHSDNAAASLITLEQAEILKITSDQAEALKKLVSLTSRLLEKHTERQREQKITLN